MSTTISYLIVYFKNWVFEINNNRKNLPLYLSGILFGFLLGNLFGILTKFFSGTILQISITAFLELVTFFQYVRFNRKSDASALVSASSTNKTKSMKRLTKKPVLIILNLFKQGFLIGIFLEAFKVGS